MEFIIYHIDKKNVENDDIRVEVKILQSEPETTFIELEGSERPAILETIDQDEDKTKSVRARRLTIGFNSNDTNNVDSFKEADLRFQAKVITDSGAIPFIGDLVQDDISEAFQPKPNPVTLKAGEGFGKLKGIQLTESDGDIPIGHYRISNYIALCLRHINFDELPLFVAFNLYEEDTDPDTSHAFFDMHVDASTFETEVDERDDCFTVLEKILDAFGCFITFDNSAYYIIRWDEWDNQSGDVVTLRLGEFDIDGVFQGYSTLNVDKVVAHDADPDYEGYYLSNDSALRRFQIKAEQVKHIYRFEQPKEIPCNSEFTRGTIISDTPTEKTYSIDCWDFYKGPPNVSNDGTAFIKVTYAGGYEDERFFVFDVQPTNLQYYIESQRNPVKQFDKFSLSVDVRHDGQVETAAGAGNYNVMQVRLYADSGNKYTFHPPEPTDTFAYWELSDATFSINNNYFKRFYDGTDDDTEWHSISVDFEDVAAIPESGYITICLHQTKKSNEFQTHFANLQFKIVPLINGTYDVLQGQQQTVSGNQSGKFIEKEMFIGESPHPLFKGALKKFDGVNYVLTETWQYYNDIFVLSGEKLSKHILFQWWNQYRKTRTIIETDIQGIRNNIPTVMNRWTIKHGSEGNKFFMLTSFLDMNFYTCGWHGVFVETSDGAGDRIYSDQWEFKFIR